MTKTEFEAMSFEEAIEWANENLNDLTTEDIVSATFSATRDLDAAYPAKFARELPGWDQVPLFCVQEMYVEGSLESCVRVMLLTELDKKTRVQHVYLGGAERLRPDLKR
jgi:chorismate mutase